MIHILTRNPETCRHLKALLERMDEAHTFYDAVEPLLKAVRKMDKGDHVFYDLQLEDVLWAFERLYKACKKTNLVTFEPQTKETSIDHNQCPAGVDHYLLLPANPERARLRIRGTLQAVAKQAKERSAKRAAKPKRKRATPAAAETNTTAAPKRRASENAELPSTPMLARYLHARSEIMRVLLFDVEAAAGKHPILFLKGDEGAEFELLAREINFRGNGDAAPLHMINPLQFDSEDFAALKRIRPESDRPEFIYLGTCPDWTGKTAAEIEALLLDRADTDAPAPHLIFAAPEDAQSTLSENVLRVTKRLEDRAHRLDLPSLADRPEDIRLIALSIFSTLRMAHPFMRTHAIDADALDFLEKKRADFDYSRLTRLIRNAMALGKNTRITAETMKSLSDDSPVTQHLIESLADEEYFNAGQA